MSKIILIETSTSLCSVALAEEGAITAYRESSSPKAHASLTAVFVQEVLAERGLAPADCDAVCVSKGPGSYTGLRVGVSTAKGICFGSGKPLLAVGTLDTLVAQAEGEYKYIIPMIDARRMEVYSAVFEIATSPAGTRNDAKQIRNGQNVIARRESTWQSQITPTAPVIPSGPTVIPSEVEGSSGYTQITETLPKIIDENSFAEYLEQGPCLFIGDGAGKCADVIKHPNAHFCQCNPKASAMLSPAMKAYNEKRFEDVAYFEPFYLKEFVATASKKKLF